MTDEALTRVVALLEELVIWTKVGVFSSVERLLREQFGDASPEVRLSFELLDGERSQKDVIERCKSGLPSASISPATLSRWTTKWERMGLVAREGRNVRRLFSLEDFGIEIPDI